MTSMWGAPLRTRWRGSRRGDIDQAKFLTVDSLKWVLANKAYTPWYLVRYYRLAKFKMANPHVILRGMVFLGKNVEIHSTPDLSRLEIGRWVHIGDGNAIRCHEGSLRIGDTVKIDGFEGRITDIRTRYTLIRARDGREAIVPNEMLITQRVENSSLADQRITAGLQVAYGTDLRSLLPQLEAAVIKVSRVVEFPAPAVRLMNFAPDGLDLAVHFWIIDPENGIDSVRSEVNFAVLQVLNDNGVEIPYPQRVVHMAPAAPTPAVAAATS